MKSTNARGMLLAAVAMAACVGTWSLAVFDGWGVVGAAHADAYAIAAVFGVYPTPQPFALNTAVASPFRYVSARVR